MTEKAGQIRGKVAQIISARSLVLNIGSEQGVRQGMVFAILNRRGETIVDPDTKKTLGSLLLPKVRVRITSVYDRFSLARTYRVLRTSSGLYGIPSAFLGTPEVVETLRAGAAGGDTEEELDEADSIVKVGDPAVQLVEDEEPVEPETGSGGAGE